MNMVWVKRVEYEENERN